MSYLVIDWLCIKVAAEELDTRSVAKTSQTKGVVFKIIIVNGVNGIDIYRGIVLL